VSREQWTEARKAHLAREKENTRHRDELARQRRQLPWVRVEEHYVFDTPQGKVTLADLFRGKSQLVVYHFMFGPDWAEGCPSWSFVSDHLDGAVDHLLPHRLGFHRSNGGIAAARLGAFRFRAGGARKRQGNSDSRGNTAHKDGDPRGEKTLKVYDGTAAGPAVNDCLGTTSLRKWFVSASLRPADAAAAG